MSSLLHNSSLCPSSAFPARQAARCASLRVSTNSVTLRSSAIVLCGWWWMAAVRRTELATGSGALAGAFPDDFPTGMDRIAWTVGSGGMTVVPSRHLPGKSARICRVWRVGMARETRLGGPRWLTNYFATLAGEIAGGSQGIENQPLFFSPLSTGPTHNILWFINRFNLRLDESLD